MVFRSVRSRLYQILLLLGVILALILASYFISKRAGKWEQMYYRVVQLESILSQVIAEDRDALGQDEKFAVLQNDYKQFRSFCTECHAQKTSIIEDRLLVLRQLHENEKIKFRLKDEVRKLLSGLLDSVHYIHEHHIVTLKNLLKRNLAREEVDLLGKPFAKNPQRSAPELDIIGQAVSIQNSLTAIFDNFYSISTPRDLPVIEKDFKENMQAFYRAVNTFEDYSLDAQDGLLVEELLDSGRVFEKSIVDLAHLEERKNSFLQDLQNNGASIGVAVTKVGVIIDRNRQRFKKQATAMTWGSLVIVLAIILLIFIRNREIITSIQRMVRETEKIRLDSAYQIDPDELELEEFQILSRSLNTMAAHINENIRMLHQEVTDRIKVERRLATEKERLAVTLQSIGDGVITTDTQGRITIINKVAEALTGWSRSAAVGNMIDIVFNIINEETRKPCDNPVEKVLATGMTSGLANHTILIARDGTERGIVDSGAPICDQDGGIIGAVLVFRDVSEERKLEEEIARRQKLESVGVLAGGIAHDFNNILVGILGNINLASQLLAAEHKAYPLLQHAEKASQRAKKLTRQLLIFSKGGEPVRETAKIDDIIRESVQFVLSGSKIKCNYSFAGNLWLADIDKGQVSQVIQNLVINACQAMPGGGTIDISCENSDVEIGGSSLALKPGRYLKIKVHDYGIGISKKILDKIFDPYFTTKQHGSGLGLAICYSVIHLHGGLLRVESQPNEGTVFTIYLPAAGNSGDVAQTINTTPVPGTGKIMIMDDDDLVCSATAQMLEFFGYTVVIARDGEEAIKLYKKETRKGTPVDVIIMDLTIPGGMGGEEAVREILALNSAAGVIVSSGYANNRIMAHYRDYGFKAALVKPFELSELTRVIAEVVAS